MFESLKIAERPRLSEWAEGRLILPQSTSPNDPGRLSFARSPYMRGVLDCFTDPKIMRVVLSWGSQCGKSLLLNIGLAGRMELCPGNGLWAMTNRELMHGYVAKRLMPFINANPCLARHLLRDPAKFKPGSWELDCMSLKFVGAGSPSNLSSETCSFVFADECAKYQHQVKEEASPLKLIMERTKGFSTPLQVLASTPTYIENEFWQEFCAGDMCQFFVPCPYCGGFFAFEFNRENVVWDKPSDGGVDIDLAERTTRYLCPHCKEAIWNEQKFAMMEKGEWRPSPELRAALGNPNLKPSTKVRSFQLSTLYSPYKTFGEYTRKFLECLQMLDMSNALHNLRNSWGGLPWEHLSVNVKQDDLHSLCSTYRRGELPEGVQPYYISVGYDPGGTSTHWVACAVCEGGEMFVLDWGTIMQFESVTHKEQAEDGQWVDVIDSPGLAPHFRSLRWGDLAPTVGFVDSGYQTGKIYTECAMLPPGVLTPTKGSPSQWGTWALRPCGPAWPGRDVLIYVDHQAKTSLYADTIAAGKAPLLHLPRREDVTPDLLKGLSGQKLVRTAMGGEKWRDVAEDHFGDCIKIQRVGFATIRPTLEDNPALPETSGE